MILRLRDSRPVKGAVALTVLLIAGLAGTGGSVPGHAASGSPKKVDGRAQQLSANPAGPDSRNEDAFRALDQASAFLRAEKAGPVETPVREGGKPFEQQELNLETAKQLLEFRDGRPTGLLKDDFRLARLALIRQAAMAGVTMTRIRSNDASTASGSVLALMSHKGITPTEEQIKGIQKLDDLPSAVRTALASYLGAFLDFDRATNDSFAKMDEEKARKLKGLVEARINDRSSQNESPGPSEDVALEAKSPARMMAEVGVHHLEELFSARLALLISSEELASALKREPLQRQALQPQLPPTPLHREPGGDPDSTTAPPGPPSQTPMNSDPRTTDSPVSGNDSSPAEETPLIGKGQPAPPEPAPPVPMKLAAANQTREECEGAQLSVSPVICIDLNENVDNTYKLPYALQIDAGGNDTYLNNAGGSGGGTAPVTICPGSLYGAASLLDLDGQDSYRTPLKCGGNGGGAIGGAGSLIDLSGNDVYLAGKRGDPSPPGPRGLNGGGENFATGFLFDAEGDDEYTVKGNNEVYGTNGGGWFGLGFLLDKAGNDTFSVGDIQGSACPDDYPANRVCNTAAANGGGAAGLGILIDLGGSDSYKAAAGATNGGGGLGSGFLFDGDGHDSYEAGNGGTNGGSQANGGNGAGFLFDAAGNDAYVAGKDGTNGGGGLLIDGGGLDLYRDRNVPPGTGQDRTVVPKGGGAQIDANSPAADLALTMSDSPDPVPAGRNLTYLIEVANNGPHSRFEVGDPSCETTAPITIVQGLPPVDQVTCSPPGIDAGPDVAEDVTLTDELPGGVNLTSADASSGSCKSEGNVVTCSLGDLANGATATVRIVVTPHRVPGTVISNSASVASSPNNPDHTTPDPDRSNNVATADTTVSEEEPVASVSVGDASAVQEGGPGGRTEAVFEVSLSGPPHGQPVTVKYETLDGTATAQDRDFEPVEGTLSLAFRPGEDSKLVTVTVQGDENVEADETFALGLSDATNAMIDRGRGGAVIIADDVHPSISIEGESILEGSHGVTVAEFSVSLSKPSSQTVLVDFESRDDSASVADKDYLRKSGTLEFSPGATRRTVSVPVLGDTVPEGDESFFVTLSQPIRASIDHPEARGRILDDDERRMQLSPRRNQGPQEFQPGDLFAATEKGGVNWFDSQGGLIAVLRPPDPGSTTTGMAFDLNGNLYVTSFSHGHLDVYEKTGKFLKRILLDADFKPPESIVFDREQNMYVGQATPCLGMLLFIGCEVGGGVQKLDATGETRAAYIPIPEQRGTDWVELAEDQCTLYYTSEGHAVKRFNVCTGLPMSDFAQLMAGPAAYALRILPDDGVLVAYTEMLIRFDSKGKHVQTYSLPGASPPLFFAMNIDPDGKSFWTQDMRSGQVYRFDLATGAVLTKFFSENGGIGFAGGLAVFGECTAGAGCPRPGPKQEPPVAPEPNPAPVGGGTNRNDPNPPEQLLPPPAPAGGPAGSVNPFNQEMPAEVPPAAPLTQQQVQQSSQQQLQQLLQQASGNQQSQALAGQFVQSQQLAPSQGGLGAAKQKEPELQVARSEEPAGQNGARQSTSGRKDRVSGYQASGRELSFLTWPLAFVPALLSAMMLLGRPQKSRGLIRTVPLTRKTPKPGGRLGRRPGHRGRR